MHGMPIRWAYYCIFRAANAPDLGISDRFWRRRFNADPHVIGKNLRLDGHVYPIVGVMPPSFLFPNREADLWCPIPAGISYGEPRENNWFTVIGRLKPGVMVEQARANLATVQAQLGQQFPKSDARLSVGIQPLKESTVGCNGSHCFPPKVSAFSPAAFSDSFPI